MKRAKQKNSKGDFTGKTILEKILPKSKQQSVFDFLKKEGVIKEQADGFCEFDQDKATKEIPAETVARWKKVKVSA
jgi:hypothetical protein